MAWHKKVDSSGNEHFLSDDEYYGTPQEQLAAATLIAGFVVFALAAGLMTYLLAPSKTATAAVIGGIVGVVVALRNPRPFAQLAVYAVMSVYFILVLALIVVVLFLFWIAVSTLTSPKPETKRAAKMNSPLLLGKETGPVS